MPYLLQWKGSLNSFLCGKNLFRNEWGAIQTASAAWRARYIISSSCSKVFDLSILLDIVGLGPVQAALCLLSGMMNKFFSGLQSHLCDKSEPSVLFPILLILTILTTFPCEVRKTRLHYFMLDNWKRTFCRLRGHSPNNDAHSNDAKSWEEKRKRKKCIKGKW